MEAAYNVYIYIYKIWGIYGNLYLSHHSAQMTPQKPLFCRASLTPLESKAERKAEVRCEDKMRAAKRARTALMADEVGRTRGQPSEALSPTCQSRSMWIVVLHQKKAVTLRLESLALAQNGNDSPLNMKKGPKIC